MIAVTGATGQAGGRVALALAERGLPLRLVVRDATRAQDLPGAEVAVGEYRDGAAMRAAFEGADTVYLVSGSESADRVAEHFRAREVVYERETLEQARESRRPSGAPGSEIEGWVTSYATLEAGDLVPPSDTVREILGRPPRSLADVLREHPETMAHLRR